MTTVLPFKVDADCSNSNVMQNFEISGWKDLDFTPRNLVKMICGKVNEKNKTHFLLYECLDA